MRVLRGATWEEVTLLFSEFGGARSAVSNLDGWARRYKCPPQEWYRLPVRLTSWHGAEIWELMRSMAEVEPRVLKDEADGVDNAVVPPRVDGLPIALVRFGSGQYGIIDGKHRANKWKYMTGEFAAYLIHAN